MKDWAAFLLLGLIWGSSFLWIKIGVAEIGPFLLVTLRLLFGLLGLLLIAYLQKQSLAINKKLIPAFLFMALFNLAVPITLISWGEIRIDSSLAAILNATVPLFTIVIAHFWLHDEKINLARVAGLIVGFVGVIVLVGQDIHPERIGNVWAQLAVVVASISYATSLTFSRKYLRNQQPIVQSTMMLLLADAIMWTVTPLVESPVVFPTLPITWLAVVWLGLLGSGLAYILFFYLINKWGATRTSIVTYIFPIIGLILGIVFLGEQLTWNLAIGSLLIVAGIAAVNFKTFKSILGK